MPAIKAIRNQSRYIPYLSNITTTSRTEKYERANLILDLAEKVSGKNVVDLLKQVLFNTRRGKEAWNKLQESTKLERIVHNLRSMHESADRSRKSNVISLLTEVFSREELVERGFNISRTK